MKKKILIVEDDPVIVVSLEFLMIRNGYDVLLAKNGVEAMELLTNNAPDLVLLDVMLPDRTGLEICQEMRSKKEFDATKIILLSAKGREIDIEKGLTLGADAYVTKPFSTRELVKHIQDLLGEETNES